MKLAPLTILFMATLLLVACSGGDGNASAPAQAGAPATAPATAPEAAESDEAAKPAARKASAATPAEIAAIEASGRTGLWAKPAELCNDAKGQVVVLSWNAKASGAGKVAVNLAGKDGNERSFGRGGPVGRKSTGAWARAGQVFILRSLDDNAELARATLAGKQC